MSKITHPEDILQLATINWWLAFDDSNGAETPDLKIASVDLEQAFDLYWAYRRNATDAHEAK
jgi:hypothetical protein